MAEWAEAADSLDADRKFLLVTADLVHVGDPPTAVDS
jgi:hypothetical protein